MYIYFLNVFFFYLWLRALRETAEKKHDLILSQSNGYLRTAEKRKQEVGKLMNLNLS